MYDVAEFVIRCFDHRRSSGQKPLGFPSIEFDAWKNDFDTGEYVSRTAGGGVVPQFVWIKLRFRFSSNSRQMNQLNRANPATAVSPIHYKPPRQPLIARGWGSVEQRLYQELAQ